MFILISWAISLKLLYMLLMSSCLLLRVYWVNSMNKFSTYAFPYIVVFLFGYDFPVAMNGVNVVAYFNGMRVQRSSAFDLGSWYPDVFPIFVRKKVIYSLQTIWNIHLFFCLLIKALVCIIFMEKSIYFQVRNICKCVCTQNSNFDKNRVVYV